MFPPLASLLFTLLLSTPSLSTPANVTVDDTLGDTSTGAQINYNPADLWSLGQDCTDCTAKVDRNQVFAATWHDGSFFPVGSASGKEPGTVLSASYVFKGMSVIRLSFLVASPCEGSLTITLIISGTAIYAYCILFRTSSSPDGNTDMTFLIDDAQVGTFELAPNGDKTVLYDQLVFSQEGLEAGKEHNFTILNGLAGNKSLVLLDRLVYT